MRFHAAGTIRTEWDRANADRPGVARRGEWSKDGPSIDREDTGVQPLCYRNLRNVCATLCSRGV